MAGGAEVLEDNTGQVVDGVSDAVARALERIGLVCEGYAKIGCPVDTGRLRNSITHEVAAAERAVYVGTNVEYAPHVEMGTSRQAAQPFLRPAATNHADQYREILRGELRGG